MKFENGKGGEFEYPKFSNSFLYLFEINKQS